MFNVALRPCEMFVCIFFKGGEMKGEIYRGRGGGRINTETEKNKKRGIYRD